MCCGTEAGSCLRLIDSCITQLKAQGPARTCNESEEEEEHLPATTLLNLRTSTSQKCESVPRRARFKAHRLVYHSTLGFRVIKKKKNHPSLISKHPSFIPQAPFLNFLFLPGCRHPPPVGAGSAWLRGERFRGALVLKIHRLLYHSTLVLRVIKKKKKLGPRGVARSQKG